MSIENVALAIINDGKANSRIQQAINQAVFRYNIERAVHYRASTLRNAAVQAGVLAEAGALSAREKQDAWYYILEYIYCDNNEYILAIEHARTLQKDGTQDLTKLTQVEDKMEYTIEHKLNGKLITAYTEDQLIELIRKAEKDIKSLEEIKTQSDAINKKIVKAKEVLSQVVKHLDSLA